VGLDGIVYSRSTKEYRQYLSSIFLILLIISISTIISCDEKSPEKGQKPPQKISSSLSNILTNLESPQKDSEKQLISTARVDEEGRVQIYVKLYDLNEENLNLLKADGLKIDIYDEQQKLVQGWALPENIKIMSQFDFVKKIDLPSYGYTR
jgi:hypothetical protein